MDPTCVPANASPCLSLPDILLPSTISAVSFSLKVLARLLTGKEVMLAGDDRHRDELHRNKRLRFQNKASTGRKAKLHPKKGAPWRQSS